MQSCQNNPEKSYTEKETKRTSSGYSLFTNFTFDSTKNKLVTEEKTIWKSFVKY